MSLAAANLPVQRRDPGAVAHLAGLYEARELGAQPAGLGRRALACAFDLVLGFILAAPAIIGAALMLGNPDVAWPWPIVLIIGGAVLLAIYQLTHTLTHGLRGVTAGKAVLRLRSTSTTECRPPGFWRIALRALVLAVSCLIPLIGPLVLFLSSLWDELQLRRSYLDRLARCWVVDIRRGLNPLDEAAVRGARRERDLGGLVTAEQLVPLASDAPVLALRQMLRPRSHAGVVGFAGALAGWESGTVHEPVAPVAATPASSANQAVSRAERSPRRAAQNASQRAAQGAAAGMQPRTHRIIFDDGTVIEVPQLGVIGRDPAVGAEREPADGAEQSAASAPGAAPAGAASAAAVPIRIADDSRRLSKAHIKIGIDDVGCWITDLGSANGTELRTGSGQDSGRSGLSGSGGPGSAADAVTLLPPGERRYLAVGTVVHIGGRAFQLLEGGVA